MKAPNEDNPHRTGTCNSNNNLIMSSQEYVNAVKAWVWAYHNMCVWQLAPLLTVPSPGFLSPQHTTLTTSPQPTTTTFLAGGSSSNQPPLVRHREQVGAPDPQPVAQQQQQQPSVTRVYHVATYGRRLVAEALDSLLGFVLKLVFVYLLVEFGFVELDRYNDVLEVADLKSIILLMQDLMPLEMACKVMISVVEGVVVFRGISGIFPPGCTPGKFIVGIRVIRSDDVISLGTNDGRVNVRNPRAVDFQQSMLRSFGKNFAVGFFFPLCIVLFLGRNNRAMYDVVSGTVVVEME